MTAKPTRAPHQGGPAPRRHRMTTHQVQWLRRAAKARTAAALTEAFNTQFAAALAVSTIKGHWQRRAIAIGSKRYHRYTKAETDWLAANGTRHTDATLAGAFNAVFASTQSRTEVAHKARSLGAPPRLASGRSSPYTKAQERWLAGNAARHEIEALAAAFNGVFSSQLSTKQIAAKCKKMQLHAKPAPRDPEAMLAGGRWCYSAAEETWLRTHATRGTWLSIERAFANHFGHRPGVRSITTKCERMKIARPKPSGSRLDATEREWLRTHSPATRAETLSRRFKKRFGWRLSVTRIYALGAGMGLRTGRRGYPFASTENTWIEDHCANLDYAELTSAFNKRFNAAISTRRLQKQCRTIGCRAIRPGIQREYSAREIEWLRRHAPRLPLAQLAAAFTARFGRASTPDRLRDQCRKRKIPRHHEGLGHARTAIERTWLETQGPQLTVNELTERFNKHFSATVSSYTIRSRCRAFGIIPIAKRHSYTAPERSWLRREAPRHHLGELTRRFNERFQSTIAPGTLASAAERFGVHARPASARTGKSSPGPNGTPGAKPGTPLKVAVGVIMRADGRRLMEQRKANTPGGGAWAHPGGKVEAHESTAQALERELDEELGIKVQAPEPIGTCEIIDNAQPVHLTVFLCTRWTGTPVARSARHIAWTTAREADQRRQLPGVAPVERLLASALQARARAHRHPGG